MLLSLSPILMILWIPLLLIVFPMFKGHRAILFGILLGQLFLPEIGSKFGIACGAVPIAMSPLHFEKQQSISYALALAAVIYLPGPILAFRPAWYDLPMAVFCLCPFLSALNNPPPPDGSDAMRDGLAQVLDTTCRYGVSYLLGRIYFTNMHALRDLIVGSGIAAIVYAPLCLFESRLSPQLHSWTYGFAQHFFAQTIRFGGYRPMVYMSHGLVLAIWMVLTTLALAWLWWNRPPDNTAEGRDFRKMSVGLMLCILLPTVVLLRSFGAVMLGLLGWCVLYAGRVFPTRLWLIALVLLPPTFIYARVSGWKGDEICAWVKDNIAPERADSLQFRFANEDLLIEKALEHPTYGWGGWGRARIYNEEGKDVSITDGLWIIILGDRGLIGLVAMLAMFLLPAVRFMWMRPPNTWFHPASAPASALVVCLALWNIDQILNGGGNPYFGLVMGAVSGLRPSMFREQDEEALREGRLKKPPVYLKRLWRQEAQGQLAPH